MSVIDPYSADFDDYPWDPFYDGGPGDLYDPADFVTVEVADLDPIPAPSPEGRPHR